MYPSGPGLHAVSPHTFSVTSGMEHPGNVQGTSLHGSHRVTSQLALASFDDRIDLIRRWTHNDGVIFVYGVVVEKLADLQSNLDCTGGASDPYHRDNGALPYDFSMTLRDAHREELRRYASIALQDSLLGKIWYPFRSSSVKSSRTATHHIPRLRLRQL